MVIIIVIILFIDTQNNATRHNIAAFYHAVMGVFVHREELLQSLAIVQHCLLGAGSMLPPLEGPRVPDL